MIKTIAIIILVLSLLDLTASYLYVNQFSKKYPTVDPTIIEANPILKYSMKHFGVQKGMIFGGIIVFAIVLLVSLSIKENGLYYMAGVFSMMLIYHTLNFKLLLTT